MATPPHPGCSLSSCRFTGCGRSDRTASFPSDIWIDEARQVDCLAQHLELDEVSLIGTSGGAWVALNATMMMKGSVSSLIADSFDGRTLNSSFSSNLIRERESAMKDEDARGFHEWCLGPDWQDIVLKDTQSLPAKSKVHPYFPCYQPILCGYMCSC